MSSSYEEILLAIAVKNKLVNHEAAVGCLSEFRAMPAGRGRPIEELMIERGMLSPEQAMSLSAASRKLMAAQVTQKYGGSAPAAGAKPAGAPNPAEPIPGYRIVGKLGVGGTATVFLAEDRKNANRKVALKILHPTKARDEKALSSFLRESQLLVQYDHPNLVKGYANGRMGPLAWVAMEYLDGESVQDVVEREKALPEKRSLQIILETAKALEYTQHQGIVHRDIKPGNIMVLKDGRIKVCDLGFAFPIGSVVDESTTSGTVQYMSPEQARGAANIDVRADIYSLGASLYHMVMGELPFAGNDSLEVMAKQVMEALNSTAIKNKRISRHMHYFIERMMSKDQDLRYGTPTELIADITEQIEGFESLEYKPEESPKKSTRIMQGLSGGPPRAPTGQFPRPTTSRLKMPTRRIKPPGQA